MALVCVLCHPYVRYFLRVYANVTHNGSHHVRSELERGKGCYIRSFPAYLEKLLLDRKFRCQGYVSRAYRKICMQS